jgi:hypothetical protein
MAFDIRTIFSRSLGGRSARIGTMSTYDADALDDDETPVSPIAAASVSAEYPDSDDLSRGGATPATLLIPEGLGAVPSAAVDTTSQNQDDVIDPSQARTLAEIAVMAASIHGRPPMNERQDLLESLRSIPGLDSLARDEMERWIDRMIADGGDRDPDAYVGAMEERIDEIAEDLLDPELRRAAYQMAVYFAAWHGQLDDAEEELLDSLSDAFEITGAECSRLRRATLAELEERAVP